MITNSRSLLNGDYVDHWSFEVTRGMTEGQCMGEHNKQMNTHFETRKSCECRLPGCSLMRKIISIKENMYW